MFAVSDKLHWQILYRLQCVWPFVQYKKISRNCISCNKIAMALQGLPLSTSSSLENLLLVVSNLAMKGSIFIGELTHFPDWTAEADMVDLTLSPYYKRTSLCL
jgi:hypothetical protein